MPRDPVTYTHYPWCLPRFPQSTHCRRFCFLQFTLLSHLYTNIVIRERIILLCAAFPILYGPRRHLSLPPAANPCLPPAPLLLPQPPATTASHTVAIALTRPHYYYTALQNGTLSATHQIQNLYTERKKPPYAKHKINANECHKLHTPK